MVWVRLAFDLTIFVTTCIALGYLAGFWGRQRKWSELVGGFLLVAISCLWPAIAISFVATLVRSMLLSIRAK
jgi:hypothetical protein